MVKFSNKVERYTQVRLRPPSASPGRSPSPHCAPLRRDTARAYALVALTRTLTVKKGVILVKKRSSFECSTNHLRRTAGKAGKVFRSQGRARSPHRAAENLHLPAINLLVLHSGVATFRLPCSLLPAVAPKWQRSQIPGAREKRGAKTAKSRQKPPKTAMKPNWDKALVGNSDPMAGRARFKVTMREPRRAVEFLTDH